jgi:serine/threonine protein kinase
MVSALLCPQCNSPLTPARFANYVVCAYCGTTVQLDDQAIAVEKYRQSLAAWNSPQGYLSSNGFDLDGRHWTVEDSLNGDGDYADVYTGRLARWPTELVYFKILRDEKDLPEFENEWSFLQNFTTSESSGVEFVSRLIPQPVAFGRVTSGSFSGNYASIFRWSNGFYYNFAEVTAVHQQGITPRASIWVWRRILEILSFMHKAGMAHSLIVPENLLIQQNEHGVRLVGFSRAGLSGEVLPPPPQKYSAYYPAEAYSHSRSSVELDLCMSARCVISLLGGNPASLSLPDAVPDALTALLQRVAGFHEGNPHTLGAWSIHEELDSLAEHVFGSPQFIPIVMPLKQFGTN